MKTFRNTVRFTAIAMLLLVAAQPLHADGTLTYLGELSRGGEAYEGRIDVRFTFWSDAEKGAQIAPPQMRANVRVTDGVFRAPLRQVVSGKKSCFLEVAVRAPSGKGRFVTLSPRRTLTGGGFGDDQDATLAESDALEKRKKDDEDAELLMTGNRIIVSMDSLLLNIDGDNTSSTDALIVGRDRVGETGGAELLRVQEDGKVGIGTATPGELLTVNGTIQALLGGFMFPDGTLQTTAFDGTVDWENVENIPPGFADGIDNDTIYTAGQGLELDADAFLLAQQSATAGQVLKWDGGGWTPGDDIVGTSLWSENGGDIFYTGGNVGIGTASPADPLHVEGVIRSAGTLGGVLTASNPNNQGASVHLSWLDDIARVRVGGTGVGAENGLDIQTTSNLSILRVLDNGRVRLGAAAGGRFVDPKAPLHVITTSAVELTDEIVGPNRGVVIEEGDARLQLWSHPNGATGSAIVLGEAASGVESDRWAIIRNTTDTGSKLRFTHTDGTPLTLTPEGDVGIGTDQPEAPLHLKLGESSASFPRTGLVIENDFHASVTLALPETGGGGSFQVSHPTSGTYGLTFAPSQGLFLDGNGNGTDFAIDLDSDIGIGTPFPDVRLHVAGGSDAEPSGGGFIQAGDTAGPNVVLDDNEIMARDNGAASTLHLNTDGGDVAVSASGAGRLGVGTLSPEQRLHVVSNDHTALIETSSSTGTALTVDAAPSGAGNAIATHAILRSDDGIAVFGDARTDAGFAAGVAGSSRSPQGTAVLGQNIATSGDAIAVHGSTDSPDGYSAYFEGAPGSANYFEHAVGIGALDPLADLHVRGVGGLGSVLVTPSNSNSDSEIFLAEQASTSFGMIVRYDGGANQLHVIAQQSGAETDPLISINRNSTGAVGMGTGTRSIDAQLHVEADGARVLKIDRFSSDGELVAFARNDSVVGNITVAGNTVSYNAFTGSHYASMNNPARRGELVSLTGDLHRDAEDSEPIYETAVTTRPNDSACLGTYLAPLGEGADGLPEGCHQIMSVGNGEMCVVDTGRDIRPGDLLISSSVPGCAMLDDPSRFPVGHIVARAAERVDWTKVQPGGDGLKRAKISVLFDRFTRTGTGDAASADRLARLQRENEALRAANAALEARLDNVEAMVNQLLNAEQ